MFRTLNPSYRIGKYALVYINVLCMQNKITMTSIFTVGIIGCGPIGIECGLHALHNGYNILLFEVGDDLASNICLWSHVQLFTPFRMNISSLGQTYLQAELTKDELNSYLTGQEYIEKYLRPLGLKFINNILFKHRVISIGRYSDENKFVLLVEDKNENMEKYYYVDYLIDASGTYKCPNSIGIGNIPAVNEQRLESFIKYDIPNLNDDRIKLSLAHKRILLVGKGHSAANSALLLGDQRIPSVVKISCD
ncbi:unnamed protein product [Didymodactylos carnosus]|uniref:FAD/NAD(P)-binding domain-containing protein n=1 Tax=Didymodactylos carnosus TaxID=1234261 RepID=A0A8S2EG60_9BILA|nr:unnamed protein product [Didymodactylos carnosus]CAF3935217.1 unnamed protein product [Didymodactylos carnosus]